MDKPDAGDLFNDANFVNTCLVAWQPGCNTHGDITIPHAATKFFKLPTSF